MQIYDRFTKNERYKTVFWINSLKYNGQDKINQKNLSYYWEDWIFFLNLHAQKVFGAKLFYAANFK